MEPFTSWLTFPPLPPLKIVPSPPSLLHLSPDDRDHPPKKQARNDGSGQPTEAVATDRRPNSFGGKLMSGPRGEKNKKDMMSDTVVIVDGGLSFLRQCFAGRKRGDRRLCWCRLAS